MQTDFLIIGQGLAGSLLAWELIQRGSKVVIVDNNKENASRVAAGIVNPVTGIRFVKSANVETLLPAAIACYRSLAVIFGQCFYSEKPQFRIVRNQTELARFKKRQQQPGYAPYFENYHPTTHFQDQFSTPLGVIEQCQTGQLVTQPLLACLKQYFIDRASYRQSTVDYPAIRLDDNVHWHDITAKRIIFCEGYQVRQNPWFSALPLKAAKGEILTLAHSLTFPDAILNYGHWLVPLAGGVVRVGATFNREQLDMQPSETGKQTLISALNGYCPRLAQSTLVEHKVGIRPCTADRQPFIGQHSKHHNLLIFNGFGAKGSLQIPWYSQRFADFILNQVPLPEDCDIKRINSQYAACQAGA